MKRIIFILACLCFYCLPANAQNKKPNVIPSLQEWSGGNGFFNFTEKTQLVIDANHNELLPFVSQFAQDLHSEYQWNIPVKRKSSQKNEIQFTITTEKLPSEGYFINILPNRIEVSANTTQGVFWATRTLLQMLHNSGTNLPVGKIKDYPNYSHRGFMLDVARKFFTIDYLRDYVKLLSYYKINEFQIHLNDNGFKVFFDEDWDKTYAAFRLESETFPELTARDGHYTKNEFRELQKMGQLYGVNVIPEIDIPAHSLAFSHYKPEIGSDKYGRDHLDLYNPETYKFCDALFKEYISGDNPTFINDDVHIGTDEYDKREAEKYREFTDRYLKYIQKLGKNVRMWGGLRWLKGNTPVHSENVVVNAWSHDWIDPFQSIKDGFKLISTCDSWLYIVPAAGYYRDFLDEKWLYNHWKPEMINHRETLPDNTPELLGAMFAVWNDHIGNGISQQDVHYRTLPAVKVLAEKMWNRNPLLTFQQFKQIADNMGEAPQVNLLGSIKTDQSLSLSYAMTGKTQKETDHSGNNYHETDRKNAKTTSEGTNFNGKSYIETPISDIGYDYRITFDLNLSDKNTDQATLFSSTHSSVYLLKVDEFYHIGFERDGYRYEFETNIPANTWNSITIEGDYRSVTLKLNDKKEKLSVKRLEFKKKQGGVAHMNFQQTLVFPLKRIGDDKHGFIGTMKNFKVFKL